MGYYLYSAKNSQEKEVTERIEAPSISIARLQLEYRGYSSIVFYEDEMINDIQKMYPANFEQAANYTPEIQRSDYHKQGFLHNLLVQLKIHYQTLIIFTILTILGLWEGSTFLWISLTLDLLLIVFFALFVLPKMAYDSLLMAGKWAEWDKVFFYAKLFRFSKKLVNLDLHEHDIDMRIATALAGKGELESALKLVKKYETDPLVAKWLYYARLASVYIIAKDYDKASECQLMAVELGPDSAGTLIDYAIGLARYHKDTVKARQVLDQAVTKESSELISIFTSFCKGVILVEEGNHFEANFHLSEAMRKIAPYETIPDLVAEIKAYWSISLAKLGEKEKAAILFQQAKPMLVANKDSELIYQCEHALS